MNALQRRREDYLRIRRAIGFKLEKGDRLRSQFVDYLERVGRRDDHRRARVAVGDAARPPQPGLPGQATARGARVRAVPADDRSEPPSCRPGLCCPSGTGRRRPTPYIYSDAEIAALMTRRGRLAAPTGAPRLCKH